MMLGAPGAPMMAAPMPAGVAPAAAAMQAAQLHSQQQQMLQQQQLQLHMFWQQQMREISDVDPGAWRRVAAARAQLADRLLALARTPAFAPLRRCADAEDFKTHQLPLARIKKIMKSDDDVRVGLCMHAPAMRAERVLICALAHVRR